MTNVEIRGERLAFMEGVCWVTAHLFEAGRRVENDQRGVIKVEGKPNVEAVLKSGNPAFAKLLREMAETIEVEGFKEAHKRFPNFDPSPAPMRAGQSSGF